MKQTMIRISRSLALSGWLVLVAAVPEVLGTAAQQPGEKLVFEHADSAKWMLSQRAYHVWGDVRFSRGQQKVRCDEAVLYNETDAFVLRGNVRFSDSTHTLSADYYEHDARAHKEFARGHVIVTEEEKQISADEITYLRSGLVHATGDVRYYDPQSRVQLTCQKLHHDRNRGRTEAEINPVLTRFDLSHRPETVIRARLLAYDDSTRVATARDSVVITRTDVRARADLGQFQTAENLILLSGRPAVRRGQQDMAAEKITLTIENDSLRQVYLWGKGEMKSDFLVEGRPAQDRLTGAEIWIDVSRDTVRTIRIKGQATSLYHLFEDGQVQGVNQVLGDEMTIDFDKGAIRNVTVLSQPDVSRGRYYPPRAKITALN